MYLLSFTTSYSGCGGEIALHPHAPWEQNSSLSVKGLVRRVQIKLTESMEFLYVTEVQQA